MIVWCDGSHDVVENMRRDRERLATLERDEPSATGEAMLRLFGFAPPGITLGHAQRPERALDLDRCRADGIGWAVRPTGGRAIFHADEWTYSLTARIDDPRWGGSLERAYRAASELIAASLVRLGVPARLASPGLRRTPAGEAACFASTAAHEIELRGKKLVGSAQRRGARALLQQGSILLGPGHLRLADYVAASAPRRAEIRERLAAAATLATDLDPATPIERWRDALVQELAGEERPVTPALTAPEAGSYTPSPAFIK
jgi:lipoate-protein ligase A